MSLIIEIPKLDPEGSSFEGELPATLLALEEGLVRSEGPIRYQLQAQVVSGGLLVTGRIEWPCALACVRCGDFSSTIVVSSGFLRDYPLTGGQVEVDVTPDLLEEVLLQVPQFPVCQESCAGLCPVCGANRNRTACTCRQEKSGDSPWTALNGLKI